MDPNINPTANSIIHDGYAALVEFDTGVHIDFTTDVVH
jgi:hypothetical protein